MTRENDQHEICEALDHDPTVEPKFYKQKLDTKRGTSNTHRSTQAANSATLALPYANCSTKSRIASSKFDSPIVCSSMPRIADDCKTSKCAQSLTGHSYLLVHNRRVFQRLSTVHKIGQLRLLSVQSTKIKDETIRERKYCSVSIEIDLQKLQLVKLQLLQTFFCDATHVDERIAACCCRKFDSKTFAETFIQPKIVNPPSRTSQIAQPLQQCDD